MTGNPAFDIPGTLLYAISLVMLVYGASRLPAIFAWGLIGCGAAGLLGFIFWELRVPYPVCEVRLFASNRVFAFSSLAALINYSATFAVTFLLSLYLHYILSFPPQSAGLILMAQPIVQALFSPLAGRLSDRIEPAIIASLGMAITATGLLALTVLTQTRPIAYILGALIVLGMGFALFSSPNMNAIMGAIGQRHHGTACGMSPDPFRTQGNRPEPNGAIKNAVAALTPFESFLALNQETEHCFLFLLHKRKVGNPAIVFALPIS